MALVGAELVGMEKSGCWREYLEWLARPRKGSRLEVGMLMGTEAGLPIIASSCSGEDTRSARATAAALGLDWGLAWLAGGSVAASLSPGSW